GRHCQAADGHAEVDDEHPGSCEDAHAQDRAAGERYRRAAQGGRRPAACRAIRAGRASTAADATARLPAATAALAGPASLTAPAAELGILLQGIPCYLSELNRVYPEYQWIYTGFTLYHKIHLLTRA